MVGCKRRERCTHRIARYVSWTETEAAHPVSRLAMATKSHDDKPSSYCPRVLPAGDPKNYWNHSGISSTARRDGTSFNNAR